MPAKIIKLKPLRPCPICGKPASQAEHPFCSPRCADIDLNRWLSGVYVIPAVADPAAGDEADDGLADPSAEADDDAV